MAFCEAEFIELATDKRALLRGIAYRYLNRRYHCDIEGVIQESLMQVWEHRERVRSSTTGIVTTAVRNRALSWQYKDLKHTTGAEPEPYQAVETITPELAMLTAESDPVRDIREKLSPTLRKHFDEWRSRGYVNETHAQECATSRVKIELQRKLRTSTRY